MSTPKRYKLLRQRFDHPAGTVCYQCLVHDYGMARDDMIESGQEHQSVTLKPDGGYPIFTVPVDDLMPDPAP